MRLIRLEGADDKNGEQIHTGQGRIAARGEIYSYTVPQRTSNPTAHCTTSHFTPSFLVPLTEIPSNIFPIQPIAISIHPRQTAGGTTVACYGWDQFDPTPGVPLSCLDTYLKKSPPQTRLEEVSSVVEKCPAKLRNHAFAHVLGRSRVGRAYLQEIESVAPLSRAEERDIALRVEHGEGVIFEALLRVPKVRQALCALVREAACGALRIDKLVEESPDDEVAQARIRKLAQQLDCAGVDDQMRLLAPLRVARCERKKLVDIAAKSMCTVDQAEIARGHAIAESAKRELVRRHLWLAVYIACRYRSGRYDLLDCIQEGNLGLMRAAERFRVRKGFRFATYAAWWVRRAIHRAMAEQGYCVRLPVQTVEALQKAEREQRRYSARHGQLPSEAHLANTLDVSVERLREINHGVSEAVYLDARLDGAPELSGAQEADELVKQLEQVRVVHEQVSSLELREKRVIELRFGLENGEEASRDEVAKVFSLTRERIRQIENRAIEKLRHPSRARVLQAV
ncbi:MAG: hypothetical protein CSA75_02190 [Sorangium cellulosum]|nr:MAG: hypothetical protein CSA75_02190 [Sorangium cellulosum]